MPRIRALTTKPVDYVLDCQKDDPKTEQIVWKIRPLTAKEYAKLQDSLKFDYSNQSIKELADIAINPDNAIEVVHKIKNLYEHIYNTLCYGLIGWENFRDEQDNLVEFEKNMEDNLSMIPRDFQMELAGKISELSTLKETESKN